MEANARHRELVEVYVAHAVTDKPSPPVLFESDVPAVPFEELKIQAGIFPIAETSTLSDGYYQQAQIDTRYPIDRRVVAALEMVRASEQVPERIIRALGSVAIEALEPWERSLPPEELLEHYAIGSKDEFIELSTLFLKVPPELRDLAYRHPRHVIGALRELSEIEGINMVVNLDVVIDLLQQAAAENSGLAVCREEIESVLARQQAKEDAIIVSATSAGRELQDARIERKRLIADGIDAALCRLGTNSGTIVDPAYLLDDTHYQLLSNEPEVTFDYKIAFLRHMMSGHWSLGQDHTFVYRNSGENLAATHVGVVPDYATVRPGNFLYHDLKLLEHGPFKQDFPTRTLFAYVRSHYLRQMDLVVLEGSKQPGSKHAIDLPFMHEGTRYVAPLEHNPEHVIPFRALKKHDDDTQYYEYGAECYMAELVDIALQLDMIDEICGNPPQDTLTNDVKIGTHTKDLLRDLYYEIENNVEATALAVEQLLFMKGKRAVDGRQAIRKVLVGDETKVDLIQGLTTLDCEQELDEGGKPQEPKPPLTCYYEWFHRYARPVSPEEMLQRRLPLRDSIFA